MKLTLLGTGAAAGVPVWGCECRACIAARANPVLRRRVSCATLQGRDGMVLIDGGVPDLAQYVTPAGLSALLVTHFHVDHVLGLFALRWAEAGKIPAYAPNDEAGCADLYKHSGPFEFCRPVAFETFAVAGMHITPVPLTHSRPTYGYLIEEGGARLAYLTDTKGLPEETAKRTREFAPELLVLDCSYPPQDPPPRNHNDLTLALDCITQVHPHRALLVHISHKLDTWLMQNAAELPADVCLASDGMQITL
jgi:phosphoribosyl 1,2-cyclic phosphate phosphodiesterase